MYMYVCMYVIVERCLSIQKVIIVCSLKQLQCKKYGNKLFYYNDFLLQVRLLYINTQILLIQNT